MATEQSFADRRTFGRQGRINAFAAMFILHLLLSFGPYSQSLITFFYDRPAVTLPDFPGAERPILIEIDEDSLNLVGAWPWPRDRLAVLLARVAQGQPQSVGLDILINERSSSDKLLLDALGSDSRFVLPITDHSTAVDRVIGAYKDLEALVTFAHSLAEIDADGIVRTATPERVIAGQSWPAMAIAMTGAETSSSRLLIPYPSSEPFDRLSAIDVLIGSEDLSMFQGRHVLIGITAKGIGGQFVTPAGISISGVELQAFQVAAIANRQWWQVTPWPARIVSWLPLFLIASWFLQRTGISLFVIPLLGLLTVIISWFVLRAHGLWMAPAPALLAMVSIALAWLAAEWHQSRRLIMMERARASATIAAVADGVIATGRDNRVIMVNDAALTLLGMAREEVMGRRADEIPALSLTDRPPIEPIAIRNGAGINRDVLVSTGQIDGDDGGTAFVLHDVTEREQSARALAKSERERLEAERRLQLARRMTSVAEVSAAIAHELNQPLAALTTYAATAKRTMQNNAAAVPPQLAELIEKISAQASRSAKVVKQLRGIFEQARQNDQRTDLHRTIHESLFLAEGELGIAQSQIELDLAPGEISVAHDPVQFQQLLLNLFRNGKDACGEKAAHFLVKTRLNGADRVQLSIADNGPGIAPEARSMIFEPLSSTKANGLGIGLAVCRSIAEAHGGAISVQSSPIGGAEFVLSLPGKA